MEKRKLFGPNGLIYTPTPAMVERYQPQSAPKAKSTKRVRQFRGRQQKKHAKFVASLAGNVHAVVEPAQLTVTEPVEPERAQLTSIHETPLGAPVLRRESRPSITITTAT